LIIATLGDAVTNIENIVIVGAGQAASQAIHTLRQRAYKGSITLVGDEPYFPYQRPPLSKKYLASQLERERLLIRPVQFYVDHQVEPRLGQRALEIDRAGQRLRLENGTLIPYDTLLLATGSAPRRLTAPGSELEGVHVLRTIADVDGIRTQIGAGRRVVIVGGGYIGLEVAAICRELDIHVTVLEMADRVMNRVVCSPISSFYQTEHARHGVRIVCNARVQSIAADASGNRVRAVVTDDGTEYPADVVLVAVGVVPVDTLAAAAGIECSNGIVVDEYCRTSDPHIYAAGDCTNHPNIRYGRRVRLESVDNAFEQGASAALNMMGIPAVHDKVPWFWSDQYDIKLIIIGLCQGHDRVITRGSPEARSFSACYLQNGELLAVDTVNHPKDQMAARKLVAARAKLDLVKLCNADIPLRDCL
jgi:3-phenylpropionate/trans-cinnamate dioxygenase ferredoxin reductase component